MPDAYHTLDFTQPFLESFTSRDFSVSERRQPLRALRLLDDNERHPSLRVHPLQGDWEGLWAVRASASLRLTFQRLSGGRKRMLARSRHYDR